MRLHSTAELCQGTIPEKIKKRNFWLEQTTKVLDTVSNIQEVAMNIELKNAGAKYIKQWLLKERDVDEHGNILMNLDTICDPGLLEELIAFNNKGNFDRIMSFMMVLFQIEEEGEKEYNEFREKQRSATKLLEISKKWFKKN